MPLKSAQPREVIRLVKMKAPDPGTSPRNPSSGLVETWECIAAAAARAICIGDGRTVIVEAAIGFRLLSGADGCNHRKPGTQFRCEIGIVQRDLDGNTLHDFREVASRVIGWQQRKL